MKILILNWRDIKNPSSGGAEILTHEIAKGLVKKDHKVSLISSEFPGGKKLETIDGVRIERMGHPDARTLVFSVQFKAMLEYFRKFRGNVDLIIDEFHGNPFFSPLYMKERKVALICEVGGDLWDIAVTPPFNIFGKFMEKTLPFFYRNTLVITISNSSKKELLDLGFKKNRVRIIPLGSSSRIVISPKKEKLLEKAHILIAPSLKEGWGLTVHEAGAKMTPVVSYNVPGLRDVVKNKISGIITSENTPESLAKTLKKVLENKIVYQKLQRGALNERKRHNWKNTVNYFTNIISSNY